MEILIVDDATHLTKSLGKILKGIDERYDIEIINDPGIFAEKEHIIKQYDIAFLDIRMPKADGIEIAKLLQRENPRINIIFVSGYRQYMADAFAIFASAFIEKPFRKSDIINALEHLRYPVISEKQRIVKVQCFGNFEVFLDNVPIHFYRSKSKELFAYLVDRRGAICDSDMIIGNLWPDENVTSSLKSLQRMVVTDMFRSLADYGLKDIVFRDKVGLSLDVRRVDCDYYHYLNGDKSSMNQFRGEYMNQYAFAESTRAYLERKYYE